jgi:putative FmdB family regulatory protein
VPTYEYQCRQCGRTFETVHSMREDGPSACEACGGALRRVIHPTGIIFKGSGFYSTDARRPMKPRPAVKPATAESGSSGASSDTGGSTGTASPEGSAG